MDEALQKVAELIVEHVVKSAIESRGHSKAHNRSFKAVVQSCKYGKFTMPM